MLKVIDNKYRNTLTTGLSRYEQRNGCPFIPTRKLFYERVGVNQKRFGMLLRGELPLYGYEAVRLGKFFGVEPNQLLTDEPQ